MINLKLKKIHQDIPYIDDITESVMIPMIHGLAENGVDIKSDKFITEVNFINESIMPLLFRHLGYKHPMSDFIKYIMVDVSLKQKILSFNGELVDKNE